MPVGISVDWDKVHEIIDWVNSIGWGLLLAYEYRRIHRKDAESKTALQPVQSTNERINNNSPQ